MPKAKTQPNDPLNCADVRFFFYFLVVAVLASQNIGSFKKYIYAKQKKTSQLSEHAC